MYELLLMRHDSLMFAKFGITDENEPRIKCIEAGNRLNKSKPDEIVADALSWCDMLFAAKQDLEAKARQTRSNNASKSDCREDGINGSLWKREPWFSPARKASWNDDCGRPAFSELFGIPNRIWIPRAPNFAVLGNFFFLSPFFLGSLSFVRYWKYLPGTSDRLIQRAIYSLLFLRSEAARIQRVSFSILEVSSLLR